eukprot:3197715-Prymnesium_polylepis.1
MSSSSGRQVASGRQQVASTYPSSLATGGRQWSPAGRQDPGRQSPECVGRLPSWSPVGRQSRSLARAQSISTGGVREIVKITVKSHMC